MHVFVFYKSCHPSQPSQSTTNQNVIESMVVHEARHYKVMHRSSWSHRSDHATSFLADCSHKKTFAASSGFGFSSCLSGCHSTINSLSSFFCACFEPPPDASLKAFSIPRITS